MNKQYEYIIFIGRFQPFHDGHMTTLNQAFEKGNKVIMVLGSHNAAPDPKNPWTAKQRMSMITETMVGHPRIQDLEFIFVEDRWYKPHKWTQYVQSTVDELTRQSKSIALIGHDKDSSSFYLRGEFPMWDFVETGPYIKETGGSGKVVSSTKIRELMFTGHLGYTKSNLPLDVYEELEYFVTTPQFENLQAEYNHIIAEQKIYESLPHGMNFITVDSVVVQSGHVLLVKRDTYPGKDLWALPGIHVNQNETLDEAAIRALLKETNLDVPEKALRGSLKEIHHFDHPDRSLRARLTVNNARTLTMGYYFELDSSRPLPVKGLKGGEGIKKAWWFSFAEVKRMRSVLFEDHADILDYFIG